MITATVEKMFRRNHQKTKLLSRLSIPADWTKKPQKADEWNIHEPERMRMIKALFWNVNYETACDCISYVYLRAFVRENLFWTKARRSIRLAGWKHRAPYFSVFFFSRKINAWLGFYRLVHLHAAPTLSTRPAMEIDVWWVFELFAPPRIR